VIIYKPTPKIQAMTFDLDDTLYDNWPYIIEAEKGLLNYIADTYPGCSHLAKDDWQQFKRQALQNDPDLWSDMGDLRRTTLTHGLERSGYVGDELSNAVEDCFRWFYHARSDFEVPADVCEVLAAIAKKMPIMAITNGNVNLTQIGIAAYFSCVFKANRQSPMKPHRHMFNAAAKELAVPTQHILHVGDNLEKDVWGATRSGFSSAWYACDRPMNLNQEPTTALPNVQIQQFNELLAFI